MKIYFSVSISYTYKCPALVPISMEADEMAIQVSMMSFDLVIPRI
jgi:hypothetical protein